MGAVITLTTDFSPSDAYVAAMKGVILNINPDVTLVDICHTIEPQNIAPAAFVLSAASFLGSSIGDTVGIRKIPL